MQPLFDWLSKLELPKSTDLALWWIGTIAVASVFMLQDPKDIVLASVSGLVGYLGGKYSGGSNV